MATEVVVKRGNDGRFIEVEQELSARDVAQRAADAIKGANDASLRDSINTRLELIRQQMDATPLTANLVEVIREQNKLKKAILTLIYGELNP